LYFPSLGGNGNSYKLIKDAMKNIEDVSCIQFKELSYQQIISIPEHTYLKIFAAQESE